MKIFGNNPELEKHRSFELWLDVTFFQWCGILARKKLAIKMVKLLKRHLSEIKELLSKNLDDLEISDWALDYSDGKQRVIRFYEEKSDKEKMDRINYLEERNLIIHPNETQDVFTFSKDEAERSVVTKEEWEGTNK